MRRTTPLTTEDIQVKRAATGRGLFATAPLSPGRYIEYTGPRITNDEADKLAHTRYLFEVNTRWTIDGRPKTNIARYINHACTPNCEALLQKGHIYIKVITPIHPGEEQCYDYGKEYFDEFIAPHGCHCFHCRSNTAQQYSATIHT